MDNPKILVVDDDAAIRHALTITLGPLGFSVDQAHDGRQAIRCTEAASYSVILLDCNMPGLGGIDTCRKLRAAGCRAPIIMLTVRDTPDDKIEALDAGADDYVVKPFDTRELAARLRAVVRRGSHGEAPAAAALVVGEIEVDEGRRLVLKRGSPVHLTPKEFDLLCYLMRHAGVPILHARLLQAVWGSEYGEELEYLRTFMRQLRRKLEDDPSEPRYLLTEPYIGYRFNNID